MAAGLCQTSLRLLRPNTTLLFTILTLYTLSATAFPLQNITLPLPIGTTTHNTPGLLCTPTKPKDVLTFFLLNYVAHAATVLTRPGERADDFFVTVIGCLLFPALGLYRGIEAILGGAVFARNDDLRKAARSGALCMVVRSGDWRPHDGDVISEAVLKRDAEPGSLSYSNPDSDATSEPPSTPANSRNDDNDDNDEQDEQSQTHPTQTQTHLIPYPPPWMLSKFGVPVYVHRQIIHGTYSLPAGYSFAIVPHDANFTLPNPNPTTTPSNSTSTPDSTISNPHLDMEVSATYNTVKALIALFQSFYTLLTLYRARGDQIQQFGYAAFGLTVAPYAVMSIMNLLGNLCRPDYASLYMVESSVMEEARQRGGVFHGAVARVVEVETRGVCSCGFGDGVDVDGVRFEVNDDGEGGKIEAVFTTTAEPDYGAILGGGGNNDDIERDSEKTDIKHLEFKLDSKSTFPTSDTKKTDIDMNTNISISPISTTSTAPTEPIPVFSFPTSRSPTSTSNPSITTHTHSILPLPKNLNYTKLPNAPLLFIPACNPLKLTSSSSDLSLPTQTHPPPRFTIDKVILCKPMSLTVHRFVLCFAPHARSIMARRWRWTQYFITALISLTPLLLNAGLSKFQPGTISLHDSSTWKAYTMQWLVIGMVTGIWWVFDQENKDATSSIKAQFGPVGRTLLYITSASPAVGGLVVVGQMLNRYGICTWVGD